MSSFRHEILVEELGQSLAKTKQLAKESEFRRPIYGSLRSQLGGFANSDKPQSRWIIMPGLRGVGKTTLLAQLIHDPILDDQTNKFALSLDEPAARGASVADIIKALEAQLGCRLYEVTGKIFLFLDEVHFLPNWSVDLKVLYDNCRHLFLVCTGSSALSLNLNPDSGRRADVVRVPPLSFSEYLLLESQAQRAIGPGKSAITRRESIEEHIGQYFESNLSNRLYQSLFEAESATEAYQQLERLGQEVSAYWRGLGGPKAKSIPPKTTIDQLIDKYITRYMTLPYAVKTQYVGLEQADDIGEFDFLTAATAVGQSVKDDANGYGIKKRIELILGDVLANDLDAINRFEPQTKDSILDFLRLLANSDTTSLATMSRNLVDSQSRGMSINTIQEVIKALLAAEIIVGVAPLGSSFGRVNRPYKYLFGAPALRSALSPASSRQSNSLSGPVSSLRGHLLEDTVGLYLHRLAANRSARPRLEYDAKAGGADFVETRITDRVEAIAIEVGWTKNSHRQIKQTLKRVKGGRYGLVITGSHSLPSLAKDESTVYLPLRMFLLL